ncbi:MAG: GH3 auxin-responsive promoter family protein [Dehalococcoidia bacterium]
MARKKEQVLGQDPKVLWRKYCGFLDLSLPEFMEIQEHLLFDHLRTVVNGALGKRMLRGRVPANLEEFRTLVPLTRYGDYLPELENGNDAALPEPAHYWAHTTGARAELKFAPYTRRGYERVADNLMASFIIASANRKGEVNVEPGDRVLYNTPPRPFLSGLVTFAMEERFGLQGVLDPQTSEKMDFKERIEKGFLVALKSRVDFMVSMTSILVKIGDGFVEQSQKKKRSRLPLHPVALARLAKAVVKSKIERRGILPKDLWPVKAIMGWGVDTPFFREKVARYWGRIPYQFYACTEGGLMAMQSWEKKGMIFTPYADFYEFIPEEESAKNWENPEYKVSTLLLNEVEAGKRYELVITNFYGMPFLRYRPGHLVEITALEEKETGIKIPQMEFVARCDDRIDLAGFTRLDEKTIWEALAHSELSFEDWTVRKEFAEEKPLLHVYVEFKGDLDGVNPTHVLDESLKAKDPFYNDLHTMLGINPLKVTCLSRGTFERYYDEKKKEGKSLTELRPLRMNPAEESISDLLRLSKVNETAN